MTAAPSNPIVPAAWSRVRRILLYGVTVGLFLSIAGAFGSQRLPLPVRTVFMVGIAIFDAALGAAVFALTGRCRRLGARWRLHGMVAAVVMTAPAGAAVWAGLRLILRPGPPVSTLPGFMPTSLGASLFFCLLAAYARHQRLVRVATSAPAGAQAAPRFLDRLPPKLRGAELWAVEAEDHYLRLHTSEGQDLVLMRLSDAIAELEGLEGAQTHRSWWVARVAIAEVERADGRATLTLKNGAQAPVSRTHARALRARGWL